jgi:hypothetical protein
VKPPIFKVWDRWNGCEEDATEVLADGADEAAAIYMNHADGTDGYPESLYVRAPDGGLSLTNVTTEYEPVHYTTTRPFVGPVQS